MENRRIKTEQYKRSSVATNAYAFASTFAFSPTQQPTQKKAKELASQRTGHLRQLCKLDTTTLRTDRRATDNRRLAQRRVTWLIQHSTSHQLLWCIDSFVLRNPPLRLHAKR